MDADMKAYLDAMQKRTERLLDEIRHESRDQHVALLQRLDHLAVARTRIPRQPVPPMRMTEDQFHTLEQLAEGTPWATVFALLWHTGIRIRELLALRWADVEWDTATVHVTRHLSGRVAHAAGVREVTVSELSPRRVPLPDAAVAALRQQQQLVEALHAGEDTGWNGDGWVFPTDQGQPLSMVVAQRAWARYRQQAAVSARSLNDLRKSGPRGSGKESS